MRMSKKFLFMLNAVFYFLKKETVFWTSGFVLGLWDQTRAFRFKPTKNLAILELS
jgi:hypothetical protein